MGVRKQETSQAKHWSPFKAHVLMAHDTARVLVLARGSKAYLVASRASRQHTCQEFGFPSFRKTRPEKGGPENPTRKAPPPTAHNSIYFCRMHGWRKARKTGACLRSSGSKSQQNKNRTRHSIFNQRFLS